MVRDIDTSEYTRDLKLFFTDSKITILPKIELKSDIFIKNHPVIFVHNSKTGGTSINYFMRVVSHEKGTKVMLFGSNCEDQPITNIFTEGCVGGLQVVKDTFEQYNINKINLPENSYIYGHMPLPTGDYFGSSVNYFSIVRDPIDRMLSLGNYLYQKNFFEEKEIEDLLLNKEIDNLQTRALAGEEYMKGECTEETLEVAKQNIKNIFKVVAPNEAVDIVMALIAKYYGIDNIAYTRAQVSGMKAVSRENKTLCDEILKRNIYDQKIYDYVKNVHWNQWQDNNIESISDNKLDEDSKYKVLTGEFYSQGNLVELGLEQIDRINLEQTGELIGLIQQ